MRAVMILVLVAALAVGAWLAFGGGLLGGGGEPPAVEVSPEAADAAEEKLRRLTNEQEEARLSEVELTSLLRYRPQAIAFGMVQDASVQFASDTVVVTGSVPTDALPSRPDVDAVRYLLPDTADVRVAGTLLSAEGGTAVLQVAAIEVAGMPVPARFYPVILERLGSTDGLPDDAVELPLPGTLTSARIEDDHLVLTP